MISVLRRSATLARNNVKKSPFDVDGHFANDKHYQILHAATFSPAPVLSDDEPVISRSMRQGSFAIRACASYHASLSYFEEKSGRPNVGIDEADMAATIAFGRLHHYSMRCAATSIMHEEAIYSPRRRLASLLSYTSFLTKLLWRKSLQHGRRSACFAR